MVESGGFCGGVTPLTPLVVFASRRRHAAAVGCFRCPIHLHTLHRFGWVGGRGVTPPIPLVVAAARRRRGPLAPLPAKVLVWLAHPVVPSVFALRLVKTLPLLPAPLYLVVGQADLVEYAAHGGALVVLPQRAVRDDALVWLPPLYLIFPRFLQRFLVFGAPSASTPCTDLVDPSPPPLQKASDLDLILFLGGSPPFAPVPK